MTIIIAVIARLFAVPALVTTVQTVLAEMTLLPVSPLFRLAVVLNGPMAIPPGPGPRLMTAWA